MQDLTQFSTYLFTLAIAALLPGPGMTGLMLKTFTQGHQRALLMLLGLIIGDVLFLLSSIFLIDFIHKTFIKTCTIVDFQTKHTIAESSQHCFIYLGQKNLKNFLKKMLLIMNLDLQQKKL